MITRCIYIYLGKDAEFHESIKWDVEQNYLPLKTIENCVYGRVHTFRIGRTIDKDDDKGLMKESDLNIKWWWEICEKLIEVLKCFY